MMKTSSSRKWVETITSWTYYSGGIGSIVIQKVDILGKVFAVGYLNVANSWGIEKENKELSV